MMRKLAWAMGLLIGLAVGGCSTLQVSAYEPEAKLMLTALDSRPDGSTGVFDLKGERVHFTITQTYASDVKLCRVVTLKSENRPIKSVESYCKAKGGQWR